MQQQQIHAGIAVTVLLVLAAAGVDAQSVSPTDLNSLVLGARIVGPVGPEVETSLVNPSEESIGDLIGSVACPEGIDPCVPPNNPPGTIYTYAHTVTPGVDLPNDPPFPQPGVVVSLNDVTEFALGFAAEGFNGVAGFDFSQATDAIGDPGLIAIEQLGDGSLVWTLSSLDWDAGEPITFFWQTTQPPSGPGGTYAISDGVVTGVGAGPLPTEIPEPGTAVTIGLITLAGLGARRG